MSSYTFTSESVSEGHPDKMCDMISDAILDACLTLDPNARVACETFVKGNKDECTLVIGGEITLAEGVDEPDYEAIARATAERDAAMLKLAALLRREMRVGSHGPHGQRTF